MSSFFVISFCFRFVSFLIIRKFALSGQSLFTVVMPKMAGIIIFGGAKIFRLTDTFRVSRVLPDVVHSWAKSMNDV